MHSASLRPDFRYLSSLAADVSSYRHYEDCRLVVAPPRAFGGLEVAEQTLRLVATCDRRGWLHHYMLISNTTLR
jgi:hypothetical protein